MLLLKFFYSQNEQQPATVEKNYSFPSRHAHKLTHTTSSEFPLHEVSSRKAKQMMASRNSQLLVNMRGISIDDFIQIVYNCFPCDHDSERFRNIRDRIHDVLLDPECSAIMSGVIFENCGCGHHHDVDIYNQGNWGWPVGGLFATRRYYSHLDRLELDSNDNESRINRYIENGLLPLHILCANLSVPETRHSSLKLIQQMIEIDSSCLIVRDHWGWVPMFHMIRQYSMISPSISNDPACLEVFLLMIQSEPSTLRMIQSEPSTLNAFWANRVVTALQFACTLENTPSAVIKILLQAAPYLASIRDNQQRVPLHLACLHRNNSVTIRLLIEAFPDGCSTQDVDGCTPLHLACLPTKMILENIRALVESNPHTVSVKAKDGKTPFHRACKACASMDILNLFVQANPTTMTERDQNGKLPLYYYYSNILSGPLRNIDPAVEIPQSENEDEPWKRLLCILRLHSRILPDLVKSEKENLVPRILQQKRPLLSRSLAEASLLIEQQLILQDTMDWMTNVSNAMSCVKPVGGVVVLQWSQNQYCYCEEELARVEQQLEELCIDSVTIQARDIVRGLRYE
jgi:hypothetical protein